MKSRVLNVALGMALMAAVPMSAVLAAEEEAKALPTLLIKGEVVSVDSNDPAAPLLKVKDRYGFETPIFLTKTSKLTQGDKTIEASSLTAGTAVEVEYNFDVNTAKRHAVSVKVAVPSQAAAAPAPTVAVQPAAVAPTMATPTAPAPAAASTEAAPAMTSHAVPAATPADQPEAPKSAPAKGETAAPAKP